jgi:cystathionine beta-lyase
VLEVLAEKSRHGIFGYSDAVTDDYFNVLADWYADRFDWRPSQRWLVKTPGVVFAVCTAIRALTDEGDAVLITACLLSICRINSCKRPQAGGQSIGLS